MVASEEERLELIVKPLVMVKVTFDGYPRAILSSLLTVTDESSASVNVIFNSL